jgi:N-acetylneuraminic acid mutarotase
MLASWQLVQTGRDQDNSPTPGPRFDGATWYANGALWLFSGRGSADDEVPLGDMWRFNLEAHIWAKIPVANVTGRLYAATWVENAVLFMYGGFDLNEPLSELWRFNAVTCQWISEGGERSSEKLTPLARSGSVAWYNGKHRAWLFGGIGQSSPGSQMGVRNDLWSYSSNTNSWMLEMDATNFQTAAPQPRSNASACTTERHCWIFGGIGRSPHGIPLCDLWTFDKSGGEATRWYEFPESGLTASPSRRIAPAFFSDRSENIYLFGGLQADPHRKQLNDLWRFEPSSRTWVEISGNSCSENLAETWPSPRSSCCTWIDAQGDLWLYGGYGVDSSGDSAALGDLWVLRL